MHPNIMFTLHQVLRQHGNKFKRFKYIGLILTLRKKIGHTEDNLPIEGIQPQSALLQTPIDLNNIPINGESHLLLLHPNGNIISQDRR
jgi:hypothetical protein